MISVIICTYNRARLLNQTIASFLKQTCRDEVEHELLVVDNNSNDETRQIVERYSTDERLHYVFERKQGLSAARNRGVAETRGEIISFLDDDVVVDPAWLKEVHNCFSETHATVVGGRSYLIYSIEPPEWLGPEFHKTLSEVDFGQSRRPVQNGRGLCGLNLSFRRDVLEAAGGFDEKLGRSGTGLMAGEETDILRRIAESGGSIIYEPNAVVGHVIEPDRLQWEYFERLAVAMGRSLALAGRPAGFAVRLVRVMRSALALCRTTLAACWWRLVPNAPYRLRSADRRRLTACSRLTTQWVGLRERPFPAPGRRPGGRLCG